MKKLLALVLALVMVMGLAACGNQPAETTPAPTEAPTTKAPETTPAPEPVVIGKILILNDLLNYGYTKGKAYLGISLLDITSEQMARMYNVSETGTYVYSVEDDSAAAEAGLKSGDRIISIDGQEITSHEDVRNLVSSSKVGDELNFVIQRGLSEETLTVTVGEYVPDAMPAVSE